REGAAMTETRYPGQELQDEVLKTVRKSQEAVIDAIRAWADTVQSVAPKLPAVSMPLADKLPKPADIVASAYDFAEQLLASQRKFAEGALKATAPLLQGKGNGHAAKATAAAKGEHVGGAPRRPRAPPARHSAQVGGGRSAAAVALGGAGRGSDKAGRGKPP